MRTPKTLTSVVQPNHFGQHVVAEVVNPDENIWTTHFLLCIDAFNIYYVIAEHLQAALEALADYIVDQDYHGYYADDDDDEDSILYSSDGHQIYLKQFHAFELD